MRGLQALHNMTPKQRKITQEQIDKFKAVLADPMRPLKLIEAGIDHIIIKAEDDGIRGTIADLENQLAEDAYEQNEQSKPGLYR